MPEQDTGKTAATTTAATDAGKAAATTATTTAKEATTAATENWQEKYAARDREYQELQGRYKQYEKYGDPEKVGQWLTWAQQVDAAIKAGKLTAAEGKELKREGETAAAKDWLDGYEDLEPREQAKRLADYLRGEIQQMTKAERDALAAENKQFQGNLGTQMKLQWKLNRLQQQNPDLDIDQLIAAATEASGYGPEQVIDLMLDKLNTPKKMEAAIAKAREEAKAEAQLEFEKSKVPMGHRPAPRMFGSRDKNESPTERRDKVLGSFLERVEKLQRGNSAA